jgi:hypothetical protein
MSLYDEMPDKVDPLIILGDIDGYLHVFSKLDDDVVFTLLEMALDAMENKEYDTTTRVLQ